MLISRFFGLGYLYCRIHQLEVYQLTSYHLYLKPQSVHKNGQTFVVIVQPPNYNAHETTTDRDNNTS